MVSSLQNDLSLVRQAQAGDQEAFKKLVEKHWGLVFHLAFDMLGSHSEAEDLSQEVFLTVFRRLRDFRGDSPFKNWLYKIAVHACLDHLRKRRREFHQTTFDSNGAIQAQLSDSLDDVVARKERQEIIEKALGQLSPQQRMVLVLKHYQGLKLREIADILGISEGSVKRHLYRALDKLRKWLTPYLEEL